MDSEQYDVELISRALAYLDGLPIHLQNQEYSIIVKLANEYLKKHCRHKIVEDYIDTGPESSKKIFYCELCYQSFNKK
jgi:hypothetical protein